MSGPFNYIPFGDNPGQLYPLASQDTYVSFDAPLSVVGSGGSGPSAGVATVTGGTNIIASGDANVVINLNPVLTSMSSISFTGDNGGLVGLSTINGAPYVAGGGGAVPANLAVSSLTIVGVGNNTTNDIILQANGGADVRGFPAVTWENLNRASEAFSTLSLDIQNMNPFVQPPGAPDRTGAAQYCCPTFELNGPNGPTTCPIAASALILGYDTNQLGTPSIYTAADSVSSLFLAASSTISFNSPSFVAPANTTGISSINGVSWQYIISTLAAVT
jgi:hypothetical protein